MMTTDDVVARFVSVHGGRYSYANFEYKGKSVKSAVTCGVHGDFLVLPYYHWRGDGDCPTCLSESRKRKESSDFEKRVQKFLPENVRLDFSKYTKSNEPLPGKCSLHGEFSIYPTNVKPGGSPCRACAGTSRIASRATTIVEEFKKVHGGAYDYSEFTYNGMYEKSVVICRLHGPFLVIPMNHLHNKSGCPSCWQGKPSKMEDLWISKLSNHLGIEPIRSVKLGSRYGCIDAVFHNVAVEYDGAYWHSREGSLEKDTRKTNRIISAGYVPVRLRAETLLYRLTSVPGACNLFVDETPTDEQATVVASKIKELLDEPLRPDQASH